MTSPYALDGPTVISFSGGRTSAYMLRKILDLGPLPDDARVLFANTGKERPETLDFVHACEVHWQVPITWLEFRDADPRWTVVTYETASRNGEPFEALLNIRICLPNPSMRFCTQELKVRPIEQYMRAQGVEAWDNVVGIRADEPRRVARLKAHNDKTKVYENVLPVVEGLTEVRVKTDGRNDRWTNVVPLHEAGVTLNDITAYWQASPFDLQLQQHEGNCDLCFLKHINKRRQIMRDRPDLAVWWMQMEAKKDDVFRRDEPDYASLLNQPDLFDDGLIGHDLIDCNCTD